MDKNIEEKSNNFVKYKKTNICHEAAVQLLVNGQKLITFMCTPIDLNDLAIGHLYVRGRLKSMNEIIGIGVCSENKKITVALDSKNTEENDKMTLPNILLSSCGSGSDFDENILKKEKLEFNADFSLEEIGEIFNLMLEEAQLYKKTGGMHCSAIKVENQIFVREDIGRHNAVDKVIGAAFQKLKKIENPVLVTTGRISVDMAIKAVSGKIPVIASRSIPSNLAIEIAEKLGITLIGRVGTLYPIIYTHEERIKKNK